MKYILKFTLILIMLVHSHLAISHGDHGSINGQQAISISQKVIKQMTFKDFGFQAGKLSEPWKAITYDNINVVNIIEGHYIVKASLNEDDSLYLQIAPNGQVIEVKKQNIF